MNASPFVSVVIPTRNRAYMLGACVASVLSQDYAPDRVEVLVVGDRCTDDTPAVVQQIMNRDGRVRYLMNGGLGINAARNTGIRSAVGDAILLIDDDEIAPPHLLPQLVSALAYYSWAAGAGGGYRTLLEGPTPPRVCVKCLRTYKDYSLGQANGVAEVSNIPGGCALIWRESLAKYGLFDERLSGTGDDSEWCRRAWKAGGRFVFVHDAYVQHRVDGSELTMPALLRRYSDLGAHVRAWVDPADGGRLYREFTQAARFLAHGIRHGCVVGWVRALDHFLYWLVWPLARARSAHLAVVNWAPQTSRES